ncbi:hypothetical protein JCM24511_02586 [Saitozyma sp. JCM 24511]|nr:hypothetical protein JCM24511_02586 [Saitozyma sp. JCM 24511]
MSEPIPQLNFPRHRANPFSNVDLPTKKPQVTQGNIYTRQQSSGSGKPRQPGQSGQPGQSAPTSNRTGSCATTHRPPGAFGSPSKLKDTKSSLRPQHEQPGSTLSTPNRPQGATTATVPPQQSTGSHHAPEERSSVSRSKSMKGGTGNGGGAGNDGGAGFKQDPDALDVAASGNATGNRQASFQSQSSSFQNSFQKPSTRTSAPATAQPSNSINSMAYSDPAPPQDSHPDPGRQPSQHAHSHSSRPTSDRYYEYRAVDPRTKEEVAHHDARQAALFSSDEIPQAASERKRSNVPPPAGHPGPIQSQTASDVFGQVGPGQTLPQQYSYDPPASHAQRDVKPFPDSSNHNQSSYPETNFRTQGAHQLAQPQLPAYAPHHPRPVAASEHLAIKQERHSDTTLLPTERERSSSLSVSFHGQNWVGALGDPAEETTPMWKAMQIQEQHFQKQINKLATEKDQLRVELNRKEEASAHTADQLQESRIKNLNLEKKFDEANRAKEDMGVRARKTLDTMKRRVESLNERVRDVNKTVEDGRRIDDDKLEDIKDDLKTFKEDLKTLREGPDAVNALRDSQKLCKELLDARDGLASKLKLEEESVERYRRQVRAVSEDGKKDRERVAELENQLKEKEIKLEERMRVTKDQCEALVEQLQDALPGREALQRKVKELEHELALRDLDATKAAEDRAKLEDLQQELEAYINAFKSLNVDVNSQEDELGTLPELVQGAMKQIKADHVGEVATWKARVNVAADQIASLAAELKATQQQLESSKIQADSAIAKELAKAMGFTSERAKLEHDKARLERELDELRGELGRLRESIVTYRVSDQDGIKREQDFTTTVTAALEEKRKEVIKLEAKITELQEEVKRKDSALALSPGSADARGEHERLLCQKRDAEEKASLLESHVKTVDSLSDSLQARIRDLETDLGKSREEIVERDTQIAELSPTLEALQAGHSEDSPLDRSHVARIDQKHVKQLEAKKLGMEMALKKRSAGPSALGKDAQAQEIQDLKRQLAERDAEIEKMKERSDKENENLKEWNTLLQRYMADRSTQEESELIAKVQQDTKGRWAKEDAIKENRIFHLTNQLKKQKERAEGLQLALDQEKGRVPVEESGGTKRATLPVRSDGQPSSPLSPATSSPVKKTALASSISDSLVSPGPKRALKTQTATTPSEAQTATGTASSGSLNQAKNKKRKLAALEPSASTESVDPLHQLLPGDLGVEAEAEAYEPGAKKTKARKIQFDWKDTDDELENDDATQATQSAQDHEAQLITTATTSTTTTRTRPQRKASDAAVMSSRARTLSTDSVEMPPSTNPDNKKGRGKGRAKGAK